MNTKKSDVAIFSDKVRFEDVDASKIVHHPNYLKFLERARIDNLEKKGKKLTEILSSGYGIVVAGAEMKFIKPLLLDDDFFVATQLNEKCGPVLQLIQVILKEKSDCEHNCLKDSLRQMKSIYFYAHIKLCVLNFRDNSLAKLPPWLDKLFS